MNPSWQQWIVASVNKYFYDQKGIYNFILEKQEIDNNDYVELKVVVKDFDEQTKGCFYFNIEVLLACTSNQNNDDLYKHEKMVGYFQSKIADIPLLNSSSVEVGCLKWNGKVEQYGPQIIKPRIEQTVLVSFFEVTLEE